MPRPLIYANGSMLVGVDSRGTIRDFFYPQIGLFNHLSGHWIRMGVWVGGRFSWCDEEAWQIEQRYQEDALIGLTTLKNEAVGVELKLEEFIDPQEVAFFRQIEIVRAPGDIRLFFTHDLRIAETDIGDCALFEPTRNCMVHYKGPHYFGFGVIGKKLEGYACGTKGFGGLEGTWRDAEDGELSMKPIEQGSVDSTFYVTASPGESLSYYILCAAWLEEIVTRIDLLDMTGANTRRRSSSAQLLAAAQLTEKLGRLDSDILDFAKRSVLLLDTHQDGMGGILAATDSDIMKTARSTYCYVWPRDGALVAEVLDELGLHQYARDYFRWLCGINRSMFPPFLQRYRPDWYPGPGWHPLWTEGEAEKPFQEDESSLSVLALVKHLKHTADLNMQPDISVDAKKLLIELSDFLVLYADPDGLPLPSYDLWEERRAVHAFTVASVILALQSVGDVNPQAAARAETMRESFLHAFVDEDRGVLVRSVTNIGEGYEQDLTVDASLLCVLNSGLLEPTDPLAVATAALIEDRLWVHGQIGGLARYEGDYYFRQGDGYPGNPWIITTMWLAQYKILAGDTERALELVRWAMKNAAPTGVLPEQLHPYTGEHLSVSPLTWSHAEFLRTVLMLGKAAI